MRRKTLSARRSVLLPAPAQTPAGQYSPLTAAETARWECPPASSMTYTVNVPVDGRYKLDFNYGNGQGSQRNDILLIMSVNVKQSFALMAAKPVTVIMESTPLFQTMTGTKTLYYDLTAGEHQITVTTEVDAGMMENCSSNDFVRVSYAGVYGQERRPLIRV